MKSERRHELKTNELAKGLERLPELARQYGGRILLGVILLALVVIVFRYRAATQRAALEAARQNLAIAYSMLAHLREPDPLAMRDMHQFATGRKLAAQDAQASIDAVLSGTQDKTLLAAAMVARGDLNFLIATLPPLPVAATQPALQMDLPPSQALAAAKESYEEVLQSYSDQPIPVSSARFGLAAIAEQNGEWGTAAQLYETLQKDDRTPLALKTLATARAMILEQIKQPIYLATAAAAPTQGSSNGQLLDIPADTTAPLVQPPAQAPATQPAPSTARSTAAPATPAAAPAAPAVAPTTAPTTQP